MAFHFYVVIMRVDWGDNPVKKIRVEIQESGPFDLIG